MRKFSAAVAAAVMGTCAYASDWQHVMPPGSPAKAEYDRESVLVRGNLVKVWTRALYSKPFIDPLTKLPVAKVLNLWEIDCVERTRRTIATRLYESIDSTSALDKGPVETMPRPIDPDSFEDGLRVRVCPR